jgi:hypothetical protein
LDAIDFDLVSQSGNRFDPNTLFSDLATPNLTFSVHFKKSMFHLVFQFSVDQLTIMLWFNVDDHIEVAMAKFGRMLSINERKVLPP